MLKYFLAALGGALGLALVLYLFPVLIVYAMFIIVLVAGGS